MPAVQPYWGKPAVRNDRGDGGNVGIIRSPLRATVLPDCGGRSAMVVPTATLSTPNVVGACRLLKERAFFAKKVGSVRVNAERRDYQHKDGIASFAKFISICTAGQCCGKRPL